MRISLQATAVRAVVVAGFVLSVAGFGPAFAADLDPYDEPEGPPPAFVGPPPPPPLAVLPPPQVPVVIAPCGPYRPCLGPYARFYRQPPYAYVRRAYAPIGREGYGYDYDREPFERSRLHGSRYGYDAPPRDPYAGDGYRRRPRVERDEQGRPYADPLGQGGFDRRRGDRFGGYGERGGDRFDRGPRPERDPYDRG